MAKFKITFTNGTIIVKANSFADAEKIAQEKNVGGVILEIEKI